MLTQVKGNREILSNIPTQLFTIFTGVLDETTIFV